MAGRLPISTLVMKLADRTCYANAIKCSFERTIPNRSPWIALGHLNPSSSCVAANHMLPWIKPTLLRSRLSVSDIVRTNLF